ncbi:hypothetical protein MNBD_NITROSPINAE01-1586 [hydrothermal vent metagenome]|uniref:RNA polymerase sigma factor 70 region 4 type 2 domain-containing protein n=1 Tax=hydrothermal vent metagenome TaxID=652676 RepID=A0A3B1C6L8_9ZZZZ
MLKALTAVSKYRGDASVSTWLFAIATRVYSDSLRSIQKEKKLKSHQAVKASMPSHYHNVPENHAERLEIIDCLEKRMEWLPTGYSRILVYREIEGRGIKDIAALENSTPGAIKTRLSRARIALRNVVESQCQVTRAKHDGSVTCAPKKSVLSGKTSHKAAKK